MAPNPIIKLNQEQKNLIASKIVHKALDKLNTKYASKLNKFEVKIVCITKCVLSYSTHKEVE
jgi:hypothetical protein